MNAVLALVVVILIAFAALFISWAPEVEGPSLSPSTDIDEEVTLPSRTRSILAEERVVEEAPKDDEPIVRESRLPEELPEFPLEPIKKPPLSRSDRPEPNGELQRQYEIQLWDALSAFFDLDVGTVLRLHPKSGDMRDALSELAGAMSGVDVVVEIEFFGVSIIWSATEAQSNAPKVIALATAFESGAKAVARAYGARSSAYALGGSSRLDSGGDAFADAFGFAEAHGGHSFSRPGKADEQPKGGRALVSITGSAGYAQAYGGNGSTPGEAFATAVVACGCARAIGGNATTLNSGLKGAKAHATGGAGGVAVAIGGRGAPARGAGKVAGGGGDATARAPAGRVAAVGGTPGLTEGGAASGSRGETSDR